MVRSTGADPDTERSNSFCGHHRAEPRREEPLSRSFACFLSRALRYRTHTTGPCTPWTRSPSRSTMVGAMALFSGLGTGTPCSLVGFRRTDSLKSNTTIILQRFGDLKSCDLDSGCHVAKNTAFALNVSCLGLQRWSRKWKQKGRNKVTRCHFIKRATSITKKS